jgi:hypothetical protein
MGSLNLTTADAAMKQLYKDKNFREGTYTKHPLLAILPKNEGFYGKNMPLVIQYGNPQGVSATFSVAQAATTSSRFEDFLLTRVNEHSVATIDGETLEAMSNDAGAFVTGMKAQIDAAMKSLADRLESLIPGTGTGTIGQISSGSTVASATITLENINDIVNFEVGMTIVTSATDGGALSTGSATGEVIAAVNRRTGVLTSTSVTWATVISGIAASDYICAKGDAQAAGTKKVITGFAGWLPIAQPAVGGGDSLFGVDRSTDSRLVGNYYDGSADLIEEALINGQSIGAREEASIDTAILNHAKYRQLIKELGSKVTYTKVPARTKGGKEFAQVAFSGIEIHGDAGEITIMAANKIPSNVAYELELETWTLCSIGPATKFNMPDGNRVLRQASDDGVEARLVFRGNLGCNAPWANTRVALSA